MSFSYPLLVETKIDWYRWQVKWLEVNKAYHAKYFYAEDTWECVGVFSSHKLYNYRNFLQGHSLFIYANNHSRVGLIPLTYQYSSGLNNPNGFHNN